MNYVDFLKDFGPLIGVILFFIWRDWQREEDLKERVKALENFQQETLISLSKKSTEIIEANTQQLKWMANIISFCHAGQKNGKTKL